MPDKSSISVEEVVTNEELLEALRGLQDAEEKRIPVLTQDEIVTLKKIARERTAFSIVFSKLHMYGGIAAAGMLTLMALVLDWHQVKALFKFGG